MKSILILLVLGTLAVADVPDVVINYKNSSNGVATFAGTLSAKPKEPMGITVDNSGNKFSTLTDKDGNWAISFHQLAVDSDITVWDLHHDDSKRARVSNAALEQTWTCSARALTNETHGDHLGMSLPGEGEQGARDRALMNCRNYHSNCQIYLCY